MIEDLMLRYPADDVMDAAIKIHERFDIATTVDLNIHFVPNVLSNVCSIEIEELKDGYILYPDIALVIVTCNPQDELDKWKIDNNIPDFWYVFSDFDRDICKKFSVLNKDYDIPERLTCLVSRGILKWIYHTPIEEKRNMLFSNDLNNPEVTQNIKNIEE
jgi:peroxiredoxin